MNKNTPVLECVYDLQLETIIKIGRLENPEYAPLRVFEEGSGGQNIDLGAINKWWRGRSIPASRQHLQQALEVLAVDALELLRRNYGLSLSDQYWFNDKASPRTWVEVNYFTNGFSDDVGCALFGEGSSEQTSGSGFSLMSPDASVDGVLRKKWVIQDDIRYLIKGGQSQEPYNELIATRLFERLLLTGDYVPYDLYREKNGVYSRCANMIGADEELIPAWHIINYYHYEDYHTKYEHCLESYRKLGATNAQQALAKMIVCDALMANFDRHYNNFGLVRNVKTLRITRVAPLWDTGNSLFVGNSIIPDDPWDYVARPFYRDARIQVDLVKDFTWYDGDALQGFDEEVREILSNDNLRINQSQINSIVAGVRRRIIDIEIQADKVRRALQ
jgi:hypothetical protein